MLRIVLVLQVLILLMFGYFVMNIQSTVNELTIQLDNEKIISIVQEVSDQYSFFEGQRVKVVKSNYRSRVQPFNN